MSESAEEKKEILKDKQNGEVPGGVEENLLAPLREGSLRGREFVARLTEDELAVFDELGLAHLIPEVREIKKGQYLSANLNNSPFGVHSGPRKKYRPTAEHAMLVYKAATAGADIVSIASMLGISVNTLKKYFQKVLLRARDVADMNVAYKLYQKAMSNDKDSVTACIFWAKARMGWRDRDRAVLHEHTGANGGPISFAVKAPVQETYEEFMARHERKKIEGNGKLIDVRAIPVDTDAEEKSGETQ